ncbi:MAG: hypothetical protein K0V04_21095 [Deltaproteobacteria bacterium]|nr:hypothetical protein [Deltaproteobacteria bacterium]
MSERLPIVLCCAEESEVALVAVVDALHRDGHAPEVVPGVETDSALLTEAADRMHGAALFVLCQSQDLDRFQVRRLQGLFSARKGPYHRMVTVDVPPMQATGMLPAVRDAARSVVERRGMGDEEDDGRYMRDVVMPTSVAMVPGAGVPEPPRRARGGAPPVAEPRGISREALGLDGETEIIDPKDLGPPAVPVPEPDVLISTDPTDELQRSTFDDTPGDGVPSEIPEDLAVVGESESGVETRGVPGSTSWARSGPVEVDRVARTTRTDPRAEADARPLPSASTPIDVGMPPEPLPPVQEPRRTGRVVLLLLAAAGMAAVVGMAVLHGSAPQGAGPLHQTVAERGAPVVETPADDEPGQTEPVVIVEPRKPEAVPPPDLGAIPTAAGSSTGGTSAASGDGDEAGTESGATTAAEPDSGSPEPPATPASPTTGAGGKPSSVPPPPSAQASADLLAATIDAAIEAGRLTDVDGVLVLSVGGGTTTWDEANGRCRRRRFEGLRNWRLPSKGQLYRLRKAKALRGGSYWSRSVVGGDEVYALDAGSGRMNMFLKIEPNAKAICVRKRP